MRFTDRAAALSALDDWFDSQGISMEDRAFLCARCAGENFTRASLDNDLNYKKFREGLAILQTELTQTAVVIRRQMFGIE